MTRAWKLRFGFAALPALLGFAAWYLLLGTGRLPDYVLYMRISLGYLLLAAGMLIGLAVSAALLLRYRAERDSTQRLMQVEADAAERRRLFLRRLDHELKNPLTGMQVEIANLGALPSGEKAAEPGRHAAELRLQEQVSRLTDLVIGLRKLGELETHPLDYEPVDLNELLRDLVDEFNAEISPDRTPIALQIADLPWSLPPTPGDADLLYLALRNVIANAVKYAGPDGAIQVRAFDDGDDVLVEIADAGPGISEAELPFVWDELFRGQNARGSPGSGLGLSLVKAIVERHGGQAALRSKAGQGTVVSLRLKAHR